MPNSSEQIQTSTFELLAGALLRALWAFRTELILLGGLAAAWQGSTYLVGDRIALVTPGLIICVAVGTPPIRRALAGLLARCSVRRQWHRAVRIATIGPFADRLPMVTKVHRVPAGHRLLTRVPPGATVADLEAAAETMAAVLEVREIRVSRDAANAAWASITIVRRDPLAETDPVAWPHRDALRLSLWEPIPVGVGDDGQPIVISLPERNVLIGGEPGSGKSAALSMLAATAALDPSSKLWLLDGKLVELACWAGCAEHSVGNRIDEAIDVLRLLQTDMDLRFAELLAARRRKVSPDADWPLQVVVCDELAFYVAHPDRKARTEFTELLRDLVARGRAAGVIVLAATQKPSADVVPTSLRDLFGFRWAMRCLTPQASDTILGAGWASLGYSASDIDAASRGVGWLLHEGGEPVRMKSCWLDDEALVSLSHRAEQLRSPNDEEAS